MTTSIKELENPPIFQLITDDQQLAVICRQARQYSMVALDTEFVRVRTLYPQLGLLQLYAGDQVYLIDPLAIQNSQPFIDLLLDEKVLKVLHACGEDVEVFQHYFQQVPKPLMDTQIMARFLNFPNSMGLATLLQTYFQLELDKGASRTDWLARPLSETQLRYAAADVWYLLPLYQRMLAQLEQTQWLSAAQQDCQNLLEKRLESQQRDPESAYLDIDNAWRLRPQELMRLKLLAKWRMEEAMARDLALNFVVRAENLWAVAKSDPKSIADLLDLGLSNNEIRLHGKKMLQILRQAARIEPSEWPNQIKRVSDDSRHKNALAALSTKLNEITPDSLPRDLIASKRGLDGLIKWHWGYSSTLPDLLQSWRKPYGEQLLATLKEFD